MRRWKTVRISEFSATSNYVGTSVMDNSIHPCIKEVLITVLNDNSNVGDELHESSSKIVIENFTTIVIIFKEKDM